MPCKARTFLKRREPNACLCPVCRRLRPGTFPRDVPGLDKRPDILQPTSTRGAPDNRHLGETFSGPTCRAPGG